MNTQNLELTTAEKEVIKKVYAEFKKIIGNEKSRRQQSTLIAHVSNTLSMSLKGIFEAPTGTGKTMAYLIPGIVLSILRKKVLIVSTATTSLQDQVANIDVPILAKALAAAGINDKFSFAVAKGRERYLCVTKLKSFTEQNELFGAENEQPYKSELFEIEKLWAKSKWDGIKDSIEVRPIVWNLVKNTVSSCLNKECPDFEECPYFSNNKTIEAANLIIANHDYILSSFVHNQNSKVCNGDSNYYVFDEAHHLPDKCIKTFKRDIDLQNNMAEAIFDLYKLMNLGDSSVRATLRSIDANFQQLLFKSKNLIKGDRQYIFEMGQSEASINEILSDIQNSYNILSEKIANSLKQIKETKETKEILQKQLISKVELSGKTVQSLIDNSVKAIEFYLDQDIEKARWISESEQGLVKINCSPFDAGLLAKIHLWSKIKSVVFTSATLTTLGNFESFKRNLGLSLEDKTLLLDSPLDYTQTELIVPANCVQGNSKNHSVDSIPLIKKLIFECDETLGILVYFTSKTQMQMTYDSFSRKEKKAILIQDGSSPTAIVEEHKKKIDQKQKSIIFGLDSVSEGLDLPGEYCTRVIIAKIPFPQFNDPVLSTHAKILERDGKSPFSILFLPMASRKMAQVAGRLVRREGDYGHIFILDRRMTDLQYGKQLLKSTPFKNISTTRI